MREVLGEVLGQDGTPHVAKAVSVVSVSKLTRSPRCRGGCVMASTR